MAHAGTSDFAGLSLAFPRAFRYSEMLLQRVLTRGSFSGMKVRKKNCCNDLNAAKVLGLLGAAGACGLAGILVARRSPLSGAVLGTVMGAGFGIGMSRIIERLAKVKPYRNVSPYYGDYDTESGL